MQHHSLIVRASIVLACLAGIVACGDDDTESTTPSGTTSNADGSCTGARLTDEQLCKLTCKTTTSSEAQAILGTPKASTSSNGSELLDYDYTCVKDNQGSVVSWDLYFSSGVLTSVSIASVNAFAGAKLPACIASCGQ